MLLWLMNVGLENTFRQPRKKSLLKEFVLIIHGGGRGGGKSETFILSVAAIETSEISMLLLLRVGGSGII